MRTVYVNGDYLPETEARVSIFDRGFLMADGVYEVTSVLERKLIDVLPTMVSRLKSDPLSWYKRHDLEIPDDVLEEASQAP